MTGRVRRTSVLPYPMSTARAFRARLLSLSPRHNSSWPTAEPQPSPSDTLLDEIDNGAGERAWIGGADPRREDTHTDVTFTAGKPVDNDDHLRRRSVTSSFGAFHEIAGPAD